MVKFDVPPNLWDIYPDMFIWNQPRTCFELAELTIIIESEDGAEKAIKGWESMRLTAGQEEVRSVESFPLLKKEGSSTTESR